MPLIAILLASLLLQNSPQTQLGTIEGTVTSSVGTPISGVHVRVLDRRQTGGAPTLFGETTTDGAGNFVVRNVPVGLYEIEIEHEAFGYRRAMDGTFRDGLTVSAGQSVRIPPVLLTPAGAIYGHVLDASGNGVSSVRVEILRQGTDESGRKVWGVVSGTVLTDDQGAYRKTLFGAGDYYVRTVLESGPVPVIFYYPETTESSNAAPIIFAEGSEIRADIRIASPFVGESFQISGKVKLPPVDVASPFIELVMRKRDPAAPIETSSPADVRASTRAAEDVGNFQFRDIRPGNYELRANARIDGRSYTGNVLIDVRDRDLDAVEVLVRPPAEVKGRLLIDDEQQNIYFSRRTTAAGFGVPNGGVSEVRLLLVPMNSPSSVLNSMPNAVIDPTGKLFSFGEIAEGNYKLNVLLLTDGRPSQALYVEDIRAGGKSVIDSGFQVGLDVVDSMEVVVGTKPGSVEGRIAGGRSSLPAALILIPEASRRSNLSLYQVINVDGDDHFQVAGIAPGQYKLFAVPYLNEPPPFRSMEFIARYESRAISITVHKGMTSGGLQVPVLPR